MAHLSNYAREALLNNLLRGIDFDPPANVYLAAFSSAGSLAEIIAGTLTNEITGYDEATRPEVTFGAPADGGEGDICLNTGVVEYTVMPAVTCSWVAAMDSDTKGAGNVLVVMPLSSPEVVGAGNTLRFPVGDLDFSLG